jgi:hypothetical protein
LMPGAESSDSSMDTAGMTEGLEVFAAWYDNDPRCHSRESGNPGWIPAFAADDDRGRFSVDRRSCFVSGP